MLTRRGFVGCALCAVAGFSATGADAQQGAQTAGLKRTILSRIDGPTPGYETIEAKVEAPANGAVARHIHYGIENSYILEGSLMLDVEGVGPTNYGVGDAFQVPAQTPHSGKSGEKGFSLVGVYVVEKGKPLATPV